jgi:hypothetical protein
MRIYVVESAPVYEYVQSKIMIVNKVLLISVKIPVPYTLSGKIRSFGWFHIPLLDPGYGGVVMEQGRDEVRLVLLVVKYKFVD